MKLIVATLIATGALLSAPAMADANLARAKNCMACHLADKKLVGPSYQEVAARYRGKAGAEAELARKIKAGGVGVWGQVPMPPNPQVTDAEIATLVKWILAGAK